ncbi:nitroreductase family deazaflavin-dependent oxidoreductase [Nocardia cyriacigeorgica]|uniref:Nitroreductase family deazaflavin-dependent oxidoreductase n=1 Tax=Nocardia cyriacigeorgica TaxID=135487 RepID=A0A6P1D9P2_9NOCA|nr:nitroreductase family deazaflavin-dependent oxidoreductase [Nocardia cyriacigeorgica]NEW37318.1 nitroreductase family deazaflavin-dependent oxidoreductase [Nocardia cyriacigeorgica]NEW47207.1 nitroreductase family deazaflavin-dependent oxidoreductase [Nocardia cyriacigeorgica]NEW50516.1 nitroreductase family deazaflavin-dependent oxidoreductase [Nocardia cyriacigeorgica]NEW58906.1 nitroreductase family deazaflavin-dependent oxidoreductase [Nocardia cyriacigeorgica]
MALPRALGKFNRQVANPVTSVFAGHAPGMGIVIHKGRKSGRGYRTPVLMFSDGHEYRIALTYGRDVDWVKNVLAAGDFTVETHGQTVELTDPLIRHDSAASWAPAVIRQALIGMSVPYFLEARTVD